MFNIIKEPCSLCSHEKVCSMKGLYQSFFSELDKTFKVKSIPECVKIEISCKYRDVDIRVRGW